MSSDNEVRIKLAPNIHQKWSRAASVRGLTLKGFISATVSAELIRTGELNPATESGSNVDVSSKTITSVTQPDPVPLRATISHEDVAAAWADYDDDADDTPRIDLSKMRPTPVLDVDAAMSDLEDDEEDWREPS